MEWRFIVLLAFGALVPATSALECDLHGLDWKDGRLVDAVTVFNQDDVNTRLKGCTTITGNIYIPNNYTGSFHLPNVTSISGAILANPGRDLEQPGVGWEQPALSLTSIEAPLLASVSYLYVINSPEVASISFPNLPTLDRIHLQGLGAASLDFPRLEEVHGDMSIIGNISSMNFQNLRSVDGKFVVSHEEDWPSTGVDVVGTQLRVHQPAYPPLDISFPQLQKTERAVFNGNVSSLSLPKLSTITDPDLGLMIGIYGTLLNISLPSLSNATQVSLTGTILDFSFPSLASISLFTINSISPLEVNFGLLKTVDSITMGGNIIGVSMPSVTNISTSLFVSSDPSIDCTNVADAWKRSGHSTTDDSYSCHGTIRKEVIHQKVLLGVEIAIPCLVAVCACAGYLWWRRARRRTKVLLPAYELDPPPKYSEVAESSQGIATTVPGLHPADRSTPAHEAEPVGRVD
ncbi:hypothetical protein V492_03712 [Pseudogymnoascus sp. VKM F-4246]|nr:hypothetical protein V492_03712 [Pseudogymnoascus sp. VKM F-4246]